MEVFLNGSSLGTTAYTAVPNQSNKLLIFSNRAPDKQPDGFVAEMIGVSTALSSTNREKLEGYLAHKWGLENKLPGNHAYRSNVPTSRTSWSAVQSFTTPTNVSAPTLGTQSTANLTTSSADLQVALTSNGNAATTVVIHWGDNDGGTNPATWDSNFTITNAQDGTIRSSITSGLSSGNTYYFRAFASNWKGDIWSASTMSFTTVTSAFRDTPVANAKLTGWWKLDGNLLDSSGNNNHGEAKFSFKPSDLSDLELWLDAKDESSVTHSSNAVSQWSDKSGNNKHVTQGTAASKPTFSTNGLNSMPTLSFDGTNDFLNRNDANPTLGSTDLDSRTGGDTWSVFVVGQGGANTFHQAGGGRSSTFIGKGGGIGSGGTFALGLLTHNGANSALSTPRWFVQQNGFSGSGAEANNNWTPGAINSPVVIGAIWDGSVTTGTLNGSAFLNSGPIGTASNQNSALRIGAISSTYGNCKSFGSPYF